MFLQIISNPNKNVHSGNPVTLSWTFNSRSGTSTIPSYPGEAVSLNLRHQPALPLFCPPIDFRACRRRGMMVVCVRTWEARTGMDKFRHVGGDNGGRFCRRARAFFARRVGANSARRLGRADSAASATPDEPILLPLPKHILSPQLRIVHIRAVAIFFLKFFFI